ncbi:transposase [Streptomyces sp. NPDC057424]|uniref:IS110 family transposase n=1 Tax=Streptomyces sp. NPDC057424 TaxID=3346127 RepID=UPI0036C6DA59
MPARPARHHRRPADPAVWNVASTTNAILELADRLVCQGVERVVMEATGSYWRPFFYLLEARGLGCWLVNARDLKNVPGRPKTDKLDAARVAKLAERGMVRASFVPPKSVRQLRGFIRIRIRTVFVQERTRHKHRVDKAVQDARIKLSGVFSDLFGMSGRAMLGAGSKASSTRTKPTRTPTTSGRRKTRATAVSGSSTATAVSTSLRAAPRATSWSNARSTAPTTRCSPSPEAAERDSHSAGQHWV